jgi:alpha-L-fucosidase
VHTLVDIVAKGGNLLLNVAPGPDGEWHEEAYARLEEMGKWMNVNGIGVYETKPLAPYRQGKWAYTKKGTTTYAFYLADAGEKLSTKLKPEGLTIAPNAKITLAGSKKALKVKDGAIEIPAKTTTEIGTQPAYLFVIN